MLEELLVEIDDIKKRSSSRSSKSLSYYARSLEKYIPWIKEQINKSKEGFIRIKREDLARAMKKELAVKMGNEYRDIRFSLLYKIIRVVLFDEGIFVELGNYDRQKVFMMRNRIPDDCLSHCLKFLRNAD